MKTGDKIFYLNWDAIEKGTILHVFNDRVCFYTTDITITTTLNKKEVYTSLPLILEFLTRKL